MKYIDAFLSYIKNEKNYSDLTVLNYKKDLEEFEEYTKKELNRITKEDIKSYLTLLLNKEEKNSTVSRHISSLKSFYKYMKANDYVSVNPAFNIKYPKKEKSLPKFVAYNELEEIIKISKQGEYGIRNNLIIELMYSTGIRVSELVNIKLSDIDYQNKRIRILGKGSYERIVYYGDYTKDALKLYIDSSRKKLLNGKTNDYLILNKNGEKITTRAIEQLVDKIIKETSLKIKISPHTLRHTFATHLLDNGCDLRSVQDLMGHKSINSTEVYTHVTSERLKNIYFKSHPRGRVKWVNYGLNMEQWTVVKQLS